MDIDKTPERLSVIKLWSTLVVLLQSDVNDRESGALSSEVLCALERSGCSSLVLDLSSLGFVNSYLCALVVNLAASARLMGARTVIVGLRPEASTTLAMMGFSLPAADTAPSLEQALLRFDDRTDGTRGDFGGPWPTPHGLRTPTRSSREQA